MKRRFAITNRLLVHKLVTLSSRGQLTLPSPFRRCYGIRPGTKIAIEVKGDVMLITPLRSTADELAGSLKHSTVKKRRRKEASTP